MRILGIHLGQGPRCDDSSARRNKKYVQYFGKKTYFKMGIWKTGREMDLKKTGRENRRCIARRLLIATLILVDPGHYLQGGICRPACGPARCSMVIAGHSVTYIQSTGVQSQAARSHDEKQRLLPE
jgi:hypothetical protein